MTEVAKPFGEEPGNLYWRSGDIDNPTISDLTSTVKFKSLPRIENPVVGWIHPITSGRLPMSSGYSFDRAEIESLASALSDSIGGLTHSEIDSLLGDFSLASEREGMIAKRKRLTAGLVTLHNRNPSGVQIYRFVKAASNPARFVGRRDQFEPFRHAVNTVLAFKGMSVLESGEVVRGHAATTLSEAESRANALRSDLRARNVHDDVLKFCRAELLQDNYFHAVLEATKSVSDKLRTMTQVEGDGARLIDAVFGGDDAIWAINHYTTENHRKEQTGFCNLLKGLFGMFRNPTAHAARINWPMEKEDAEDLFSILSLAHRRIDRAWMRTKT